MTLDKSSNLSQEEAAIKHFESLQKRYTTTHNGKHCELVRTALVALREKKDRIAGCYFCNKEHGYYSSTNGIVYRDDEIVMVLETSEWNHYYDGPELLDTEVNFCPMCGKKVR